MSSLLDCEALFSALRTYLGGKQLLDIFSSNVKSCFRARVIARCVLVFAV